MQLTDDEIEGLMFHRLCFILFIMQLHFYITFPIYAPVNGNLCNPLNRDGGRKIGGEGSQQATMLYYCSVPTGVHAC